MTSAIDAIYGENNVGPRVDLYAVRRIYNTYVGVHVAFSCRQSAVIAPNELRTGGRLTGPSPRQTRSSPTVSRGVAAVPRVQWTVSKDAGRSSSAYNIQDLNRSVSCAELMSSLEHRFSPGSTVKTPKQFEMYAG